MQRDEYSSDFLMAIQSSRVVAVVLFGIITNGREQGATIENIIQMDGDLICRLGVLLRYASKPGECYKEYRNALRLCSLKAKAFQLD